MNSHKWIHWLGCLLVVPVTTAVMRLTLPTRRGDPARLPCRLDPVDHTPGVVVRWSSEKEGWLSSGTRVYKLMELIEIDKSTPTTWNLYIKKVDDSFAGKYTCQTDKGKIVSIVTLVIVDAPKIDTSKSSGREVTFVEGTTPELTCVFTGVPEPEVTWFRGYPNPAAIGITGNILRFPEIKRYATDVYTCHGKNDVNTVTYTMNVTVNFPPEVEVMEDKIIAAKGEVVSMSCVIQGSPIYAAYWLTAKGERKDKSDWQYDVTTEYAGPGIPIRFITLSTKQGTLGFHDFGDFTCIADGESSSDKKIVKLIKKGDAINYN